MNVQDYSRNTYEDLNPTVLYSILIAINIAYISVLLFVRERLILKSSVGISLVLYSIFTLIEGSIFSDAHYGYRYHNFGYVSSCNLIWISLSYISFIMGIIIPFILVLHSKWHRTIAYREKCYKRVAKMKSYLDSGIISQEEYEKNKQDILKNIEK